MQDQTTIKTALANVGVFVNDIYDLVNTAQSYPAAIPILIDCLKEGIADDKVKEGVIRALAVKEAKGKVSKILIEEYDKIPKEKSSLRWAIGNTIHMTAIKDDIPDILRIAAEKGNGTSRQMFVSALGKFKSEEIERVLTNLLDDGDVILHALDALGKIKSVNAKEKIRQIMLNNPKSFIRKEAMKSLKKIESDRES